MGSWGQESDDRVLHTSARAGSGLCVNDSTNGDAIVRNPSGEHFSPRFVQAAKQEYGPVAFRLVLFTLPAFRAQDALNYLPPDWANPMRE